ncbi:hypothetical protein BDV95DRAFT_594189 [Massariosphaeria phaeospora]|uniref:Uncharacterized protein n=1 Tax=Massariosphaeria phaeospora TaxID=100035 RepID=A0A7C8MAA1_9PLEO|nr:hypothetical protein BDV95DRAFT_594189 [Massariosphaeria phaeospora]
MRQDEDASACRQTRGRPGGLPLSSVARGSSCFYVHYRSAVPLRHAPTRALQHSQSRRCDVGFGSDLPFPFSTEPTRTRLNAKLRDQKAAPEALLVPGCCLPHLQGRAACMSFESRARPASSGVGASMITERAAPLRLGPSTRGASRHLFGGFGSKNLTMVCGARCCTYVTCPRRLVQGQGRFVSSRLVHHRKVISAGLHPLAGISSLLEMGGREARGGIGAGSARRRVEKRRVMPTLHASVPRSHRLTITVTATTTAMRSRQLATGTSQIHTKPASAAPSLEFCTYEAPTRSPVIHRRCALESHQVMHRQLSRSRLCT